MKKAQEQAVIFVCEHGAAKSILAVAYFNKLAGEMKLNMNAVARGTHPDQELSAKTVEGLSKDGLHPSELVPQKLVPADLLSARKIISFCELPEEYLHTIEVEQWNDIPSVGENYQIARDAIVENLDRLIMQMTQENG